ncbi:MAG: leucine--tRNA ligase, partial [Bdellovibrionales bacterium]|nr:leucine--tRNA ligase [Bdellovibrionales bacterium]
MAYDHRTLEESWRKRWESEQTFRAGNRSSKPKYYVLDMFPYPSGAGLHVGHPLGYIATDIVSRYKRHQGFNVLHPMGWDAFGLPAEQYAIQTGQHPAVTTEKNIQTYKRQLRAIGLSFDWSREVNTSDPSYYKWTQWAFTEMFHAWFDPQERKARPIASLVARFEKSGNAGIAATHVFTASDWKSFPHAKREEILQSYRLAFLADLPVNWCPKLGTVLANDEVKDGISVRGGHPVEQRIMKQWSLRVSAYAERLLLGLGNLDWSESIKEQQRNWIGKSEGAEVRFSTKDGHSFEIFTTRPDTIFGVSFMVLAPESDLVGRLTTREQRPKVEAYLEECKRKSERERLAEVKNVSGVFTGSCAIHPFTKKEIPVWVGDYVLGGYGTGAIMAVPAHDSRDWAFARHFGLPILPVISGGNPEEAPHEAKEGNAIHSDFLDGLPAPLAILRAVEEIEKRGIGRRKINYRLRDAIFSRQRYWGEPFPVHYRDGLPETLPLEELPVALPEIDKYLPTEAGDPPLGRARNWKSRAGYPLELSTMPGFAGSSAYFFRYMDPENPGALVSREAAEYWREVDLYVGGSEHATGHLIYARFWTKVLFDL